MTGWRGPSSSAPSLERPWYVIQEIDVVRLTTGRDRVAQLCDQLQSSLETLSRRPAPAIASQLCDQLRELVERDEVERDRHLVNILAHDADDELAVALLTQLRARHAAHAEHARTLIAALQPQPSALALPVEAWGHLARCFCEGYRSTMRFEELAILALAQRRMVPSARA